MTSTRFQHDHSVPVPHRAHGHTRENETWRIADVNFDIAGSGGLYSSVEDMLKWARYFEDPKGVRLLETLSAPGTLTNGKPTPAGYALGLRRESDAGLLSISHGGSASGYRTHFAHWPEQKLTVITLCNLATDAQSLNRHVASLFHGKPMRSPPANPDPAPRGAIPDAERAALAGVYISEELDAVWRIVDRDGALHLYHDGEPVRIHAAAGGAFRAGPATLTPKRRAEGGIDSFTVSAGRARGLLFSRR
jgi:hypothetical protein